MPTKEEALWKINFIYSSLLPHIPIAQECSNKADTSLITISKIVLIQVLVLKPHGFVVSTALHSLLPETAAHVSGCLRFRSALNRMRRLLRQLVTVWNCKIQL